ncbi:MAG: MBL fold metallo-hydrolase [Deltaproteobacteria bacterium]|nr:MBL fold metallo-hydrolase [Deltaproteobacteria bacterium]
MDIIILGAGTGIPMPGFSSPSLVMLIKDGVFLFDIGPGTLNRLVKARIDFENINTVFITHFHPDHAADLVHLFFAARNPDILKKKRPFTITGPEGIKNLIMKLNEAYNNLLSVPPDLVSIDELDIDKTVKREYPDFDIISRHVKHNENSLAYRVEDRSGHIFTYSGDTGYCEEIIELAYNSDLLVLECSFPEGKNIEGHLTPSLAGKIAHRARVKRLALVHFYPEVLKTDIKSECGKIYKGEILLGKDLMRISI